MLQLSASYLGLFELCMEKSIVLIISVFRLQSMTFTIFFLFPPFLRLQRRILISFYRLLILLIKVFRFQLKTILFFYCFSFVMCRVIRLQRKTLFVLLGFLQSIVWVFRFQYLSVIALFIFSKYHYCPSKCLCMDAFNKSLLSLISCQVFNSRRQVKAFYIKHESFRDVSSAHYSCLIFIFNFRFNK